MEPFIQPHGWAPTGGRSGPNSIRHPYTSDARYQLSACKAALYKGYTLSLGTPANPCPKCLEKVNQK